jgi:hypothetical protein
LRRLRRGVAAQRRKRHGNVIFDFGNRDAPSDVGAVLELALQKRLQRVGLYPIVGFNECDVPTGGNIQARVASGRESLGQLMNDSHSRVVRGIFLADRATAIRGPILDEEDLQSAVGLSDNAVDALPQVTLHLVDGNDDG